ncbi:MAG: fumarylacetoacetate hydrolase family protein, partial [Acidaminococcaceae bacterium]|nr:fumarylacetoacetate hydrolase family protein [Acidaminococcaceae bacterium]
MRYYTILLNGKEKIAVSANGRELYVMENVADMNGLIAVGGTRELPKNAPVVSIGNVKLLSPIPRPGQDVLCLGINYTAHAEEAERFSKESFGGERPYPIFFSKRVCYSQGTDAPIPAYTGLVDSLDYECELGVVIGKDA